MKTKSIKKNYVFNTAVTLLNVLAPVITTPYISRVLTSEGIGAYSYVSAYIAVLSNLAGFGIDIYASREVAYIRDDEDRQKSFFWEIQASKLIASIPATLAFFILLYTLVDYRLLFAICGISLIDKLINPSYFLSGNEDFAVSAIKNIICKTASILLIFICVKSPGDLCLYAFIMSAVGFVGDLVLWPPIIKRVGWGKFSLKDFANHFNGSIKMFMPALAGMVYIYCDKIMLGVIGAGDIENGYYAQAQKLVMLSATLVTSISTVMAPRMANTYANKDKKLLEYYLDRSLRFVFFLGIPMSLGLIGISGNIVPWFFGKGYEPVIEVLIIQAPIILLQGIYNVLVVQYLISTGREKEASIIIFIGSISNVLLNALMIPKWQSNGASAASVITQSLVIIISYIYLRKEADFGSSFKYAAKVLLSGTIMLAGLMIVGKTMVASIYNTCALIILGTILYGLCLVPMKDEFIWEITGMIRARLSRK